MKLGFTKFPLLWPKDCILADVNETHTVCVCKIHQNFKLLINSSKCVSDKLSFSTYLYEDVLNDMVCENLTSDCQLQKCNLCPGFEDIGTELEEVVKQNIITNITHLQLTHVDRSALETLTKDTETFINTLRNEAFILQTHNFITKSQSKFLKAFKLELKEEVFVITGDFPENYVFLIQNTIQNQYWNNNQYTIHRFVIYGSVRDENGQPKFDSFVLISECTNHDTFSIHLFQKKLINWFVEKKG